MSPSEKLDRRIDSSSDLSQYVYDFEKQYTEYMKKGYSEKNASIQARRTLNEILQENNPGLRSSDAMYDKETGIAAIAVKDKNTGGDFLASRVAIELIPFFINFRKVNDSFHFCY